MSVSDKDPVKTSSGDGSNTIFDFDFLINSESELLVQHTDVNGFQTTLVLNTDYSINEVGNKNGSYIIFPLASSSYGVLSENEKLTRSLNLPFKQEGGYDKSAGLTLNALENSLDYLTRLAQILRRKIDRCVKVNEGSGITPDDLIQAFYEGIATAGGYASAAGGSAASAANSATTAVNSAAQINLPSMVGKALNFLRAKADESGQEYITPLELADIISGYTFVNSGEISSNITLQAKKITVAEFTGTPTITLPTITDSTKQVVCIVDFTTTNENYPSITNTNLLKKDGALPKFKTYSGARNVLIFKSVWEGSTLNWEVEYKRYGGTDLTFTDNFNRTATYTTTGSTEISDSNDWYNFRNQGAYVGCGINSSGTVEFVFSSYSGLYASYRRNVEGYQSFVSCDIEFNWTPTTISLDCMFGVIIGASTYLNSYLRGYYDGIMLKYEKYNNTVSIDNGTNKATQSFTPVAGTTYRVKIHCTPTFIGVKIYVSGSGEPTSNTIEYSGALTTSGNYLLFGGGNGTSTGASHHTIDNLSVTIAK